MTHAGRFGTVLVALCTAAAAAAGEAERTVKLNPRIAAMADNTWLKMNPEREPKSRAYSGACFGGGRLFYYGGGHFSYWHNDVELYDPVSNTWTRATEPERPEGKGCKEWAAVARQKASPKGAPYVTHTYGYASWDPERKAFFLPLRTYGTWEFDPAEKKWTNLFNVYVEPAPECPHAIPIGVMGCLHSTYVPELKKPATIVTTWKQGLYLFDYEKKQWERGTYPKDLAGARLYSTYVPEWKAHFVSATFYRKGVRLFKTDLTKGTSTEIECPQEVVAGVLDALAYDAVGKAVVVMPRKKLDKGGYGVVPWALDVATMKWTKLEPREPGPQGTSTGMWGPLWYDPGHNAHLFLNNVDRGPQYEGGRVETWAYRYKRTGDSTK